MTAGLDALELLRNVSAAYRAITTLKVEAVNISESGDEDGSSRSEQRVHFFYGAPNRIRYEIGLRVDWIGGVSVKIRERSLESMCGCCGLHFAGGDLCVGRTGGSFA